MVSKVHQVHKEDNSSYFKSFQCKSLESCSSFVIMPSLVRCFQATHAQWCTCFHLFSVMLQSSCYSLFFWSDTSNYVSDYPLFWIVHTY